MDLLNRYKINGLLHKFLFLSIVFSTFLPHLLFAQPVTITVSNDNGDTSLGSFGGAVTALNANTGGGSVSFVDPNTAILLDPGFPTLTQT